MIGSQLIGEPATKSIKGKPKAAPPKPKPVRTKPVQQKINKTNANCIVENSIYPQSIVTTKNRYYPSKVSFTYAAGDTVYTHFMSIGK